MSSTRDPVDWRPLAERMVDGQIAGRGLRDERVLDAMRRTPRHAFASPRFSLGEAYDDRPLPTLNGQTISQPYVVARMTGMLGVGPGVRVLEVGTGSGYQTAVLLELGAEVWTIEADPELAAAARDRLADRYPDADWHARCADGSLGWPEAAPFDRVLVAAAAPAVPNALLAQLADPGRLVMPTGPREGQILTIVDQRDGQRTITDDLPCRFVPLVGRQAWAG